MSQEETPKPTPESESPVDDVQSEDAALDELAGDTPIDRQVDMGLAADDLATDLDGLRTDLEEARNRALRSSAELENYRKRANRQIQDERRYANIDMLRDLLPIWDNMGRAVEAAEEAGEADALLEGFKMVYSQLESTFEKYQCIKIDALGEPFDPNMHEAISQMPSADQPPGTVLHVTQIGFRLHDRVVRPCQVVVAAALPKAENVAEEPDAESDD